ncbi:MAG: hypothetical protein JXA30_16685 [Deltaproteobacteria bacterium]|nr:hypothetical protein [Deltaproteobacteria bacterium]
MTRVRWGDSNRIARGSVPVLWDELAVVVAKEQYPPRNGYTFFRKSRCANLHKV